MEFTAELLANLLQGEVKGDPNVVVDKLCKIENGEKGGVSFLSNPAYTEFVYTSKASIIIVDESFESQRALNVTLIVVKDAREAFAKLLEAYSQYKHNNKGDRKSTRLNSVTL